MIMLAMRKMMMMTKPGWILDRVPGSPLCNAFLCLQDTSIALHCVSDTVH